jgi:hypothetical protein
MTTTAAQPTYSETFNAIYDLADNFSWETIAKEMLCQMSADDARFFLSEFRRLYVD